MPFTLQIKNQTEKLKQRIAALRYLSSHQVDVGLPASASGRSKFLLGIHERGSPIMRIPPRPVIQPALNQASTRAAMTAAMMDGLSAAMEGDTDGAAAALEAAGQAGVDGIHAYIDAGISPANSPVTVSGGWVYNRVARVGVPVAGKGFNQPLVETGELYNSFGYEIKSR